MTPVVSLDSLRELREAQGQGVKEVLVGIKDFSRLGRLSLPEGLKVAKTAREWGMRAILQWDLLMTETLFQHKITSLSFLKEDDFHALRVQDPGALHWALENTQLPLHWNVETGNHNLRSLEKWANFIGKRLERLVLSPQIPQQHLKKYAQRLPCSLELLGLGPILLLYTPRHLLEKFGDARMKEVNVLASSEESAHKNFQVRSNSHGTFLFHQKHYWLLEHVRDLSRMGITHLRLEGQGLTPPLRKMALQLMKKSDPALLEKLQATYPTPLIRGFFHRNKSEGLFSKLKNEGLEKWRKQAIGEVIGVEKGHFLGVQLREGKSLKVGHQYEFKTPEGKTLPLTLRTLKNPDLSPTLAISHGLALVGHVKGVGPKSLMVRAGEHGGK